MKGTATLGLLVALTAVFVLEGARGAIGSEMALLHMGALPNDGSLGHEYWRLIAYSFLHLSSLHLVLNLALLWWVGNIVERRVAAAVMGAAYLAAVIVAGVCITVVHLNDPRPGASLGASGGVFGLLAGALVLSQRRDAAHFATSSKARLWLVVVLCAGLGASFLPGVSLAGHIGGMVVGLFAGMLLPLRRTSPRGVAFTTPSE
jgi:membrane associated rhomboid family serine protease